MRERPILFSGPMVRAILDGKKTQTRRVCEEQRAGTWTLEPDGRFRWRHPWGWPEQPLHCPYGKPGDRLWVRETWYIDTIDGAGPIPKARGDIDDNDIYYRADGECCEQIPECDHSGSPNGAPWRPSIHMPRWLSRLTLEVVAVQVERLCSISEEDARAEGVPALALPETGALRHWEGFRHLWDEINGTGSWAANPWVWVVTFKRVEQEAPHGPA